MKKPKNDLERFKQFYANPNMEDYNYFKVLIKFGIGMKKVCDYLKHKGEKEDVQVK